MIVKQIWTEADFDKMGWHDNAIYSITFPDEKNFALSFDIDYVFKWVVDDQTGFYRWWVSPCELKFLNVLELKIDLDFGKTIGLEILHIERNNRSITPNGQLIEWNFEMETGLGKIKFTSTGYTMTVRKQPVLGAQSLLRGDL